MTRKRFVKLAMSRGIRRNDAEEVAQRVSEAGTYDELYQTLTLELDVYPWMRALDDVTEIISQILKSLCLARVYILKPRGKLG